MTILITGSSGFVGLALAEHLLAGGATVIGYDQAAPSASALHAFSTLPGRFVPVQGDVRDEACLVRILREYRPDGLVSMAAITADARRERAAPRSIFDVNVGGALAVLAAAAECGVGKVLHLSSGSVYGASGRDPALLREDVTPLHPEGLYGVSKRAAEDALRRLASLAGVSLVVGRLGTCFGPWEADSGVRDTPSAPLQVLRLAGQGQRVVLPRDSQRDWLYVRDAAAAIEALLDAQWRHPVYNLAAGHVWRMSQWCQRLAEAYPAFSWRYAGHDEPANVDYYADYDRACMDIQRLCDDTRFVPRFGLAAALDDFRDWLARYGAAHSGAAHA